MRASCSDSQLENRTQKQVSPDRAKSQPLIIDGYNLLITVEAALSNAPLFIGRDGCIRDLASIHGTYRKVDETLSAIEMIAGALNKLKTPEATWLLDQPVSNSGRLKQIIAAFAEKNALTWDVQLVINPDKLLIESERLIVSSDSAVIDGCVQWLNLAMIVTEIIRPEYDLALFDLRNH